MERWLRDEAVTVTDDRGEPALVQGVIYDITERKLAEQRYLEAEERYRILVEQLPLAIYIDALDEKATSLYNSPQSERDQRLLATSSGRPIPTCSKRRFTPTIAPG